MTVGGSGVPTPTPQDRQCQCGHSQDQHAGPTHRGICYECYRASDSGSPGSYCSRFRRPTGSGVPTPQEPEITEQMVTAGFDALVASSADTNHQLVREILAAALAGRTVVALPELDGCNSVDGGENFTVAALVRKDGTPKVHFDADDESEPGACLSWPADEAERLGLALVATARRARRLASESRKDGETP